MKWFKRSSKGFALVSAIFILVILTLLGTFLVRVFEVGFSTTTFAIQGTRAYYAAQSGFDWGTYQALQNSSCVASSVLPLSQGGLQGFTATVQCTSQVTSEGTTIYTITSQGQWGSVGSFDYVSRTVTGIVIH